MNRELAMACAAIARTRRQLQHASPARMPGRTDRTLADPAGPACPDGRLLALRCLGIPQVATRAAMSRRRTLMRSLAAFCARIQPRNTAELASLVLHMGEEIDRRERMLDAALRAVVTVPGERIPGSPAASRPDRAGMPEQICEPAAV